MKPQLPNFILSFKNLILIWGGILLNLFLPNKILSQEGCNPWRYIEMIQWHETFTCIDKFPTYPPREIIRITHDDYISNYLSIGYIYDKCIIVENSTLYINVNADIRNCTFIMKGNFAKIVVLNGIQFRCSHSEFGGGSTYMWDGIEIRENATLWFSDNEMNDAQFGIYNTGSHCIMTIYNNKFNNNLYSIRAGLYPGSSDEVSLRLSQNMFNSTSTLKTGIYKNDPLQGISQSRIAIVLNGVDLIDQNWNCNFYSFIANHSNGIVAYNSNISINNYLFKNIHRHQQDAHFNSSVEGNAIAVNIYSLGLINNLSHSYPGGKEVHVEGFNVPGESPPSFPTMLNVDRGIAYRKTNLHAWKLNIENCNKGISGRTRISETFIEHNRISGVIEKGIELFGINIGYVKVKHNEIITADTHLAGEAIGIDLNYIRDEDESIANNNVVRWNNITINYGYYGIIIRRMNSAYVGDNSILFNHPKGKYGAGILINGNIEFSNFPGNFIYCNVIQAYTPFPPSGLEPLYSGIRIVGSTDNQFFNTFTYGIPVGLKIRGDCMNSDISRFRFHDHYYGIYYEINSRTGNQEYKDNKWYGTYSYNRLYDEVPNDLNKSDIYKVYRNDMNTIRDPYPCFPYYLAEYQDIGSYETFYCVSSPNPLVDSTLTSLDSLIAIDSAVYNDFPIAQQWYQDLYLFTKIEEYNIPIQSGSVYDSFYMDCQVNGIADYYDVGRTIASINTMATSDRITLNNYQELINQDLESIVYYDSLYRTDAIGDVLYNQLRGAMEDSIKYYDSLSYQVLSTFIINRNDSLINVVLPQVTSLYSNNTASQTFKTLFRLESKFIAGSLSSADSSEILFYSTACLEAYQNGVLGLQSLALILGYQVHIIPDCGPWYRKSVDKTKMDWNIYPNPTNTTILHLRSEKISSGKIQIFTIEGEKIYEDVYTKQKQISIHFKEQLKAGVYIVVIEAEDSTWSGKFIQL